MSTPAAPTIALRHGALMPQLGLGTSPMDDRQTERAVAAAIEAGYRLVDTAENYGNEVGVGRGLRASAVPREELFVTTKFNRRWHGEDLVGQACQESLDRLALDYVDLLLIHWPNPRQDRYVQAWRGLLGLLEEGRVKAVGVSNFTPVHLERLLAETGVSPEVNQIQLNPAVTRSASRAYHDKHGIITESWSPLGGQGAEVLGETVIQELAQRYGKTPAQVVLRWHVELGLVTVPKSSTADRIASNIDIFDFSLSPDEVASISALDRGEEAAVDSERSGH